MEWAGPNNFIIVFPLSDYPGDDRVNFECWQSMITTDKMNAEVQTIHNIFNSINLGDKI